MHHLPSFTITKNPFSGSCALPVPGIELAVLDPSSGKELVGNDVEGVLCIKRPWPAAARTVYGE